MGDRKSGKRKRMEWVIESGKGREWNKIGCWREKKE